MVNKKFNNYLIFDAEWAPKQFYLFNKFLIYRKKIGLIWGFSTSFLYY